MADVNKVEALREKAKQIRKDMCVTTSKIGYSHMGGGMSMVDLAVALYYDYLNFDPEKTDDPERDRFILSKGHCSHVLYNIFVDKGMYTKEELWSEYNQVNGRFGMHPNMHYLRGIEASTGSLGHGLPIAVGFALAARMNKEDFRIICMVGDGELNEGSCWEAIMSAAHFGLGNLVLLIDYNHMQIGGTPDEIMRLDPLDKKFEAFGWDTTEIDGHDMGRILDTLYALPPADSQTRKKPVAVIANTVKGKYMPGLENTPMSHLVPMNRELVDATHAQIDAE
jgi:transketolase